jgi:hypothetical protein
LVVVSTLRPDGTIQSSVTNAGVLPHPVTGAQVVGLVSVGNARRPRLRPPWTPNAAVSPAPAAG